ncbi:MAG: hypothetical protein AB2421_01235 [Thermotaleaceae bacterium]
MANLWQHQYIHHTSSGLLYHFFLSDKTLIACILKDHIIYDQVALVSNISEYAIRLDTKGKFHIAAILDEGQLIYGLYFDNQWEYKCLMRFDSKNTRFSNLTLFIVEDKIHILIALSYGPNTNLWILKHYYWDKLNWKNHRVCEILSEEYDMPFQADMDTKNNIHLIYRSKLGSHYQIYYRKYQLLYHVWSLPIKISDASNEHAYPFIFCDCQDSVHIMWATLFKGHYQLRYLELNKPNFSKINEWLNRVREIPRLKSDCTHPSMMQVENNLRILWKQGDEHFMIIKDLHSPSWSRPEFLVTLDKVNSIKTTVLGSHYKDFDFVKIPIAYGYKDIPSSILGIDKFENHQFLEHKVSAKRDENQEIQEEDIEESYKITKKEILPTPLEASYDLKQIFQTLEQISLHQQELESMLKNLYDENKLHYKILLETQSHIKTYQQKKSVFSVFKIELWQEIRNLFKKSESM